MNRKIKDVVLFAILFLFIDQIIKIFLNNHMVLYQNNVLIYNLLSINLVHNTGAAFSILSGNRLLLVIIGIIAIIFTIYFVKESEDLQNYDLFVFSLLLGGILGNLLDRVIYGYVIDYISFIIFDYSFPIFNFADICIVVAVAMLVIKTVRYDVWK